MISKEKNFFISKDIFNCKNITITHIRLLLLLTTYKNITLQDLSYKDKLWVVKNKSRKYSTLPSVVDDLIQQNLLSPQGTGLEVKGNYITFDNFDELNNIKTLRQLFVISLSRWHICKEIYIQKMMFCNLFGDNNMRRNENWKNTNCQMGTDYQWKEVNGSIMIVDGREKEEENHEIQCNVVEDSHEIPQEYIDNQFDYMFGVDMDY